MFTYFESLSKTECGRRFVKCSKSYFGVLKSEVNNKGILGIFSHSLAGEVKPIQR